MVNSQRATVIAVNEAWQMIDLRADDGRLLPGIQGDELDRLALGYATTVHRSQGATVDTGHVLADGGGRELAYVAMSRAREATHIYTTADDTAVAVEDLTADWQQERRPRWAIDTGLPATADAQAARAGPRSAPTGQRARHRRPREDRVGQRTDASRHRRRTRPVPGSS